MTEDVHPIPRRPREPFPDPTIEVSALDILAAWTEAQYNTFKKMPGTSDGVRAAAFLKMSSAIAQVKKGKLPT